MYFTVWSLFHFNHSSTQNNSSNVFYSLEFVSLQPFFDTKQFIKYILQFGICFTSTILRHKTIHQMYFTVWNLFHFNHSSTQNNSSNVFYSLEFVSLQPFFDTKQFIKCILQFGICFTSTILRHKTIHQMYFTVWNLFHFNHSSTQNRRMVEMGTICQDRLIIKTHIK